MENNVYVYNYIYSKNDNLKINSIIFRFNQEHKKKSILRQRIDN